MTVGYGDLAPQSPAGRVFVAVWLMVGGIALLTTLIGKATSTIVELWRHKMKGKGSFEKHTDHTVLIGWEGASSEEIVNLLKQDETSNDNLIVICASSIDENPMPGEASFIRGETLTSPVVLARAGVATAERVLIRTGCDDQTLAAVLAVHQLSPRGHVVAHFSDTHKAALARSYAPGLECTSSMSVEMLVRSSQDPGSSAVINELLTVGEGATQYRGVLQADYEGSFGDLFNALRLSTTQLSSLIGACGIRHCWSILPPIIPSRVVSTSTSLTVASLEVSDGVPEAFVLRCNVQNRLGTTDS